MHCYSAGYGLYSTCVYICSQDQGLTGEWQLPQCYQYSHAVEEGEILCALQYNEVVQAHVELLQS